MPATPFPTSITPERVIPTPDHAVAMFENDIAKTIDVQVTGAFRWTVDIIMQKMSPEQAADFGAFIQSQEGGAGTFTFDLTKYTPGWSPSPGVREFRLVSPAPFNSEHAVEFGFAFSAVEDT